MHRRSPLGSSEISHGCMEPHWLTGWMHAWCTNQGTGRCLLCSTLPGGSRPQGLSHLAPAHKAANNLLHQPQKQRPPDARMHLCSHQVVCPGKRACPHATPYVPVWDAPGNAYVICSPSPQEAHWLWPVIYQLPPPQNAHRHGGDADKWAYSPKRSYQEHHARDRLGVC